MSAYHELPLNDDMRLRREYWDVSKGLQKTDGLATSEYLDSIIEDTLTGKYDTYHAVEKLEGYYASEEGAGCEQRVKEADIAAARITLLLEKGGFAYSPATLKVIHRELFRGVFPDEWVGTFRSVNITKDEPVLGGKSVVYADYGAIQETLDYDFAEHAKARYSLPLDDAQIEQLARFVSNIWQVHPFREGNTRTIAAFLLLYLRSMGFEVDNEPLKEHAADFRDALALANYANIRDGIEPDDTQLKEFFRQLLCA